MTVSPEGDLRDVRVLSPTSTPEKTEACFGEVSCHKLYCFVLRSQLGNL